MSELSLDDVVARLGKSRDYWKRRIPGRFEHLRVGREIRLTEEQYEALRDSFKVRPDLDTHEPDLLREQTRRSRSSRRAS